MKRSLALLALVVVSALSLGAGQLYTGKSRNDQPACSADYRGKLYVTEGLASANDLPTVCLQDAAGSYAWKSLPAVTATVTPINVGSVTDQTCSVSDTLTWTGVVAGEPIAVGVTSASGLSINAYASATDTVLLNVCNNTGGDQNPSSLSYTFERRLR